MRFLRLFFIFLLSLTATFGCSSSYKHSLSFNPQEPIRVAVLPFVFVGDKGALSNQGDKLAVDSVPLVSAELNETPAEFSRKLMQAELSKTSLDVVSPLIVDIELPHYGFAKADGSFELEKIYASKPSDICREMLDCDAVLYGKVTKWERSYYGLQTVNKVGLEIKLVSVRDGKELFRAEAEDYDSRGLSKGPTGYASLVVEPIKGLDSAIITDLTRSVIKKMLQPLYASDRPEFLNSAPPAIYASSHDGDNKTLRFGDKLVVVMYGTPHQAASFSLGSMIENIPMVEKTDGHYYGEYYPLPTEMFAGLPVVVHLTDQFGRATSQDVSNDPISIAKQ